MGISLDGLASGLDTTALINSVMQVEAIPQTLLKNKSYDLQSMVSALQGLNSKVAALATQATAAAKPGAMDLYAATTSSDKVVATTTSAAKAGSIDFQVNKLAQTQVTVTPKVNAVTGWPYTTMTINSGGVDYTIEPLTSNLDDVVTAVNAAGAGVTASKVAVGGGEYRLQFAATKSGEAGAFTISDPGTTFTTVKTAQDAEISLWPGTAAAQTVKSSTNTFTDLLPGVSITAKEVTATPVTLTVARDDAGITKLASDLVSGVNGIFSLVASKTAVTSTTNTSGTSTTAGIFAGDSAVRSVNQSILSAASLPVGTPPRSPSEIGISITKTGTMEFDEKKFAAALAADPAGTAAKVQEIATRIAAAATTASDKYDGTLTKKITGQESEVRDLANRISDWDTRLESRKATLQRTYSGLEVALSNMQAQQSWLTAQLGGLSSGSSSA
ncbi:flagellar hook-associated protein 2 [Arthrobacter sp. V4I6]|uniref:flagellar filament capping protein FliD n=1 Tax=unclassified Arthrobacter TaxID=235627 RepID=UPI00277D8A0D|nr:MULTISPECIES: flagellar filament capping protein FliD [unclassified Arthrobacter]MDQ0822697.1 flagellar hook-associated protein 2 [Arthrobacter sp. V1I7]MDQ0852325.1 flagellar hook-associated protein 2 [Arthrobacter sp. V4I6]